MARNDEGISPAAASAIARGELGNAMAAMLPGGIERQEKEGQQTFVAADRLPVKGLGDQEKLKALGFVFGKVLEGKDRIFIEAKLPPGWKKVATDHSMWSDLIDDTGRKRAAIFFKAAFYDYHAFIRWEED